MSVTILAFKGWNIEALTRVFQSYLWFKTSQDLSSICKTSWQMRTQRQALTNEQHSRHKHKNKQMKNTGGTNARTKKGTTQQAQT